MSIFYPITFTKHNHIVSQTDEVKLQTFSSEKTLCSGVWQAVCLYNLLARVSVEICIWLKGGLKHQSHFEAPIDAQWNTWRKTMQHNNDLNYCTHNPPHLLKYKWDTSMPSNNKTSWCTLISTEQRLFRYIISLRYFCISALKIFV